ncbi:MAG: hypothetical protein ACFB03_04120 [Paracoccaceae bacterium]
MQFHPKTPPPSDDDEIDKGMKFFGKILKVGMLAFLCTTVWQSGVAAPRFQPQDFNAYIDPSGETPATWSKTVTIQLSVQPLNAFAKPWDGFSLGTVIGPIFGGLDTATPADPTVCILTATSSTAYCTLREAEGDYRSTCPNSNVCDWTVSVPHGQQYAIVVFDVDDGWTQGSWDLVDTLIVGNAEPAEMARLDQLTRKLIEIVSPTTITLPDEVSGGAVFTFNNEEAERRERAFLVLDHAQAEASVSLSQSLVAVFSNQ